MYGLSLISGPTPEPITYDQAKAHLRIDDDEQKTELTLLCIAVRKHVEHATGRVYGSQVWQLTLDHFPNYLGVPIPDYWEVFDAYGIRLPRTPVTSVNSIGYTDTTGTPQILDPSLYQTDLTTLPPRIVPAYGKIWPIARYQMASVQVNFTAGNTPPEDIQIAMLLLLAHWYEHREAVLDGAFTETPLGVKAILAQHWDGGYLGQAG